MAKTGGDIAIGDIKDLPGSTNVRARGGIKSSGVKAADSLIATGRSAIYWLTACDTAALSMELNDSVANDGVDQWALILPASGYAHFIFDPPLEFLNGIYLDVSTTSCRITIGYK